MKASLAARFLAFDRQLAAVGVPPLTLWWQDAVTEFLAAYEHGQVLELFAPVGRGSSKSTTAYKLSLFFSLFGDFVIPPGERHYAIVLSRLKEEAAKGVAIIARWCALLRVPHHVAGDVVELDGTSRGVRVVAASVAATSGWRAYFVAKDERSKWPGDGNSEERDAQEIDTSAAAMTATHPRAPVLAFGSAWTAQGAFYDAIMSGSDAGRLVLEPTPTWIAAPHISESQLRKKERDPRRFAREYACVFSAEWEAGYFAGLIEACTGAYASRPYVATNRYRVAIDPAFQRDLFAICVAHAEPTGIVVDRIEAITPPTNGAGLSPTACMQRVRQVCAEYGTTDALSDQHHAASLAEIAMREGVRLQPIAWSATSKIERYEMTRTLMREQPPRLLLPNDAPLLRELGAIGVKLLPSGHEQIQARYGHTDDRTSALVLCVSSLVQHATTPAATMMSALAAYAARGGAAATAARLGMSMSDLHDFPTLRALIGRG